MTTSPPHAYHTCMLPTDHPQYRTQDTCQACNVDRALFGHPAGVGPGTGQLHGQISQPATVQKLRLSAW
jgi:hypothetical protein